MALAHFQRTFTDASGNVKPGLSVTVRRESDNGLAALFSDAGSVTPKSNPFNTDANGYGSFYVTDGRYRIQATDIDWRNEDLISQPSPNFTTIPQVGGDPIVESGSNANGEYTKFSDGTLFCSGRKLVSGDDTNYFEDLYYIPVTPSSNTQNALNASLFGGSGTIFTESVRVAMAPTGASWRYSAYYDMPLSSAETYDLIWSYSGRWF